MLLPPNATKPEKALVDAIDYKVHPGYIRGLKLSPGANVLPWIIEEYGLEEILRWAKDKRKALEEGIQFQRLRGTLKSLKLALKWGQV